MVRTCVKFKPNPAKLRWAAEFYFKYLVELCGFDYATPPAQSEYDLLVNFGNGYQRVQVKTSCMALASGNYAFSVLKSKFNTRGNKRVPYTRSNCDYYFLMDARGSSWLVPFRQLAHIRSMVVPETKYAQYKVTVPKLDALM